MSHLAVMPRWITPPGHRSVAFRCGLEGDGIEIARLIMRGRLPVAVGGELDDVHAGGIDVEAHALLAVTVGELAGPERAVDDDLRPGCEAAVLRQRGQRSEERRVGADGKRWRT